ncbi:MAG: hypothetical protein WCJ85_09425 [Chitinophagaceae bacterium]
MKTAPSKSPLQVVVQQVNNNTTAWMGHRQNSNDEIFAGQTFTCPTEGDLDAIEVFSTLVVQPGHAVMTIHPFDPETKKWGPAMQSTALELDKSDSDRWISFPQTGLHLTKGAHYGFRLESRDMYLGLGEAAGSHEQPPLLGGQEWSANTIDPSEKYYSYLSLAFKVELRA